MSANNKYYAILDKENKIAYVEESQNASTIKRVLKSRFKNGVFKGFSKFRKFQDVYDNSDGKKIEVIDSSQNHKVFFENELKGMGYEVVSDEYLERPSKEGTMLFVPEEHKKAHDILEGLVRDVGVEKVMEYLDSYLAERNKK